MYLFGTLQQNRAKLSQIKVEILMEMFEREKP